MTPRATYRLQLHAGFTLADAAELVPYLAQLGISHAYASPITTARTGSMHGYDVVDPTRVNPELGDEAALRALVAALRAHGMGLVIDIVPNHMGVAGGENAWWNDVLARGEGSRYARFFDIDWREKLLLPMLGAPLPQVLAEGQIALVRDRDAPELLVHGEHRVPLRPGTADEAGGDLAALLDRQHYRLAWWRTADDEINWRRFFTINDLAGLRVEDEAVFEATHALYFRLWEEGLIDGVRIDHVDGLTDPAGYLERLRARFEAAPRDSAAPPGPAYVVVEKILGPGERLPSSWPIEGTSGYDFMDEASAVLHDPAGEAPLAEAWRAATGRSGEFHGEEFGARREILDWSFQAQLAACAEAFVRLAASAPTTSGWTGAMVRRAIERLLWVFPVYRTYGIGQSAPPEDARVREQVCAAVAPLVPPGESEVADAVLAWLAGEGPGDPVLAAEAVRRFQQLSAPLAAKGVEDTAFYRHGVLLSRLDVGFDAACFALSPAEFLARAARRGQDHPHAMLATATHDHKRGEDVRARLSVLSQVPERWIAASREWDAAAGGGEVHPADRAIALQTVFGAWPDGLSANDREGLARYARRLGEWQVKALREAKLRSNWAAPDEDYEGRCVDFLGRLLEPGGAAARGIAGFVAATGGGTLAASLAQVALRCLMPGVPDLYQGCELPDYSLVDPDNRRPVDYTLRRQMLAGERPAHPKFALLGELLALRGEAPALFAEGALAPARVSGSRAGNVLAFGREGGGALLECAILIRAGDELFGQAEPRLAAQWWGDTAVAFAGGRQVAAAELFARSPVHARLRTG